MERRRTEDRTRWWAWRMVVLGVCLAALALGGCISSGDEASGGGGGGTTEPEVDCDLITKVFLPPEELAEEGFGIDLDQPSEKEELARWRAVSRAMPGELGARMARMTERTEGDEVATQADLDEMTSVLIDGQVWAAKTCPHADPSWKCATAIENTFVEEEPGGTYASQIPPKATPRDFLLALEDAGHAIELDRTDDEVLWGWLDDDGLVIRTEYANRDRDGWVSNVSARCVDGVEEIVVPDGFLD